MATYIQKNAARNYQAAMMRVKRLQTNLTIQEVGAKVYWLVSNSIVRSQRANDAYQHELDEFMRWMKR
ncbi:hypothetical protein [Paraburkholderia sp. BL21I4N1]|uniref:hypothetical protein n=1 Tax=Paraburkholderia sp. BL21I4N1 TaxID=1938801 RepID=UPI0011B22D2A|nr:hypothetical protein [Paraburkholderia sp. BL21I4N1]